MADSAPQVIAGSRKSDLALIQTRHVISLLSSPHTAIPASSFTISTGQVAGDADKSTPFQLLSKQQGGSDVGKSLWTNGLEETLVAGKVDFLVHSLKDMPTTLPPNCLLAAVSEREDTSDAVIMRKDSQYKTIDELPAGSVVGSSSSRRRALIARNWPHLQVEECRGNVDTRLSKLDAPDSRFSCILLATAGLLRMNMDHRITQRLTPDVFPYAVGQGALGIEVKIGRDDMLQLVQAADHKPTRYRALAERAMLRTLQGGCSSPIGVSSTFEPQEGSKGGVLKLAATVVNVEGTEDLNHEESSTIEGTDEEAEKLGVTVAQKLLEKGAENLLVRPS